MKQYYEKLFFLFGGSARSRPCLRGGGGEWEPVSPTSYAGTEALLPRGVETSVWQSVSSPPFWVTPAEGGGGRWSAPWLFRGLRGTCLIADVTA